MHKKTIWLAVFIGGVLLGLVLGLIGRFATASPSEDYLPESATKIAGLRATQQNEAISDQAKQVLEENIAAEEYNAARVAQMTPAPRGTPSPPQGEFEQRRLTGILEGIMPPMPPLYLDTYTPTNAWQGLIDGYYVQAYAGALVENPNQGFLYVVVESPISVEELVLTPEQTGAVRITDTIDDQLFLESEDGTKLTFDIQNMLFVDENTP